MGRKKRSDWLAQTQSHDGVDKKRRKREEKREKSDERTKRDNNAMKRYGWKNITRRKRVKGSDEECIRRG